MYINSISPVLVINLSSVSFMKKELIRLFTVLVIIYLCQMNLFAQKYICKTGTIEIHSESSLFSIDGANTKTASFLNTENGVITASLLNQSFRFDKTVVEEKMKEDYLEVNKFPKSKFKGKIIEYRNIDFSENGVFKILFEGKLTIHGKTNYIKEKGIISIKDGLISLQTEFTISLKKYDIQLDKMCEIVTDDEINLKIRFNYKPYY